MVGTAYAYDSDFTGPNGGSDWGAGTGRIYSLQFDPLDSTDPPSDAPEPSSVAMMFAGAFTLAACKRRR